MSSTRQQNLEQALEECASEPIHQIGSIQPHGALIVVSPDIHRTVLQASKNLSVFFGIDAAEAIGKPITSLIGELATNQIETLIQKLGTQDTATEVINIANIHSSCALRVHLHASDGMFVVEVEHYKVTRLEDNLVSFLSSVQRALPQIQSHLEAPRYFDQLCTHVRELTGYDSVMVYQFDNNWDGEIIAQSHVASSPSYVGMRFPASDIPPQARQLYVKNLVRIVADVDAPPVPILPAMNPFSQQPLNMTYSVLRSLSPIHMEYLRNIGVQASMVLSLLQNGRLWGLIACHHQTEKHISIAMREAAIFISTMASGSLTLIEELEQRKALLKGHEIVSKLATCIATELLENLLKWLLPDLQSALNASGIVIVIDGKSYQHGEVPEPEAMNALLTWLGGQGPGHLFDCDHLEKQFPPAEAYPHICSGLLSSPLTPNNLIVWIRKEKLRTVHWAGKYEEGLVQNSVGDYRLTPRKSFEIWTENWRGRSENWSKSEIEIAKILASAITDGLLQKRHLESLLNQRVLAEESLRKSHSLLNSVIDTSPIRIFWKDVNSRYLGCNTLFAKDAGFSNPDELIGKTDHEMGWKDQAELYRADDLKIMKSGIPRLSYEEPQTTPNGDHIWLRTSKIPLRDESNSEIIGVLGLYEDITDRKQMESEQERLRSQLQHSQKMEAIGQLTGGIAHDFNNMLAAILGYTGLAMDRFAPDKEGKLASYLGEIQTAGERARDLIAKMLAFSRGSQSKSQALDAVPLIKEITKTLRPIIPSTIEIATDIEENLPLIQCDIVQLHQMLMNLTINARDAIGEHGRIDIALRHHGKIKESCDSCHHDIEGDFVELTVKDNGLGIKPDILHRIFDPFFTSKEVGKGTGMGLSVVHGILHEHGGHIRVESEVNKGSTFILLLQVAKQNLAEALPAINEHKILLPEHRRILVIDDEVVVSRMLGEMLETQGYQTTVFNDPQQALDAFLANPEQWDAVVTDQTMPRISGAELAVALLKVRPNLPIILCTGYSDSIDASIAANLGISKFLMKPVNTQVLLSELALVLGQRATS